jgi:hypothetical protein
LPRPRFLEKRFVAPIVFDEKLYLQLTEVARMRRMSISALVRQIVADYLSSMSVNQRGEDPPSQAGAGDPPGIDLVIRMDLEDFEEELTKIESALSSVEKELAGNPLLTRPATNPLAQSVRQRVLFKLSSIEEDLGKLRSKYYSLKRVAGSNEETEKLAARLYDLRKRIKNARRQLGLKA